MKIETFYCDICGKQTYSLKELELPCFSASKIKYNFPLKYEKRYICNECAGKIATRIFTIPLDKYKEKDNEETND